MRDNETEYTRRGILKTGAGVAVAGAVGVTATGSATAQSQPYGGWLTGDAPASNFEGATQDATGNSEIIEKVGVGSGLLFGPPATLVEPGTTVRWVWTGKGGAHNVVHEPDNGQPAFESGETVGEEGAEFEHTFEEEGVYKYFCEPHKLSGMKGVIAVGEDNAAGELVEFTGAAGGPTGLSLPIVGGATAFGAVSLAGIGAYNRLVDSDE